MTSSTLSRILVVDDTRSIHEDFSTVLTSRDVDPRISSIEEEIFGHDDALVSATPFRLDHAFQGMEALQLVERSIASDDHYSLAFVDMRMPPGWDGLETVQQIWRVDPLVQVVICSAYADYDWNEVIARLGEPDKLLILKKPFEAVEILQCANALTHKWLSERKLAGQLDSLEQAVALRTASLERANALLQSEIQRREIVERELGLAQKLEAVGRLASGIAHEINTPIQYIGDSVYFLTSAFQDIDQMLDLQLAALATIEAPNEAQRAAHAVMETVDLGFLREEIPRAIARTSEGAERVASIVRAMKEFAHPSASAKTPSDINRALETTLVIARNEYKYVAAVETRFEDIGFVNCNIGELSQVFLNMIVNAAHALGEVGKTAETGLIKVTTRQADGYVEIGIADNGGGIPPEIIDKIYDPFFTTKEVGRGTGQGLAITRSIIVERHGGQINVESKPNEGTLFTLRLPLNGGMTGT